MSTTSDKLRGFVEYLYTRTVSESITWLLSADKSRVKTSIADYLIELSEEPGDHSFQTDVRVTVYDSTGDLVDSLTDQTLKEYKPQTVNMDNYYDVLSNCYEVARRQASGADKAILTILAALDGKAVSDLPVKPIGGFGSSGGGFADDLDDDVPF